MLLRSSISNITHGKITSATTRMFYHDTLQPFHHDIIVHEWVGGGHFPTAAYQKRAIRLLSAVVLVSRAASDVQVLLIKLCGQQIMLAFSYKRLVAPATEEHANDSENMSWSWRWGLRNSEKCVCLLFFCYNIYISSITACDLLF